MTNTHIAHTHDSEINTTTRANPGQAGQPSLFPDADLRPSEVVRDCLADLCPSCRSSDLRLIGADMARCRGCDAGLMRDARDGSWARLAKLFGGKRLAKPRRVRR